MSDIMDAIEGLFALACGVVLFLVFLDALLPLYVTSIERFLMFAAVTVVFFTVVAVTAGEIIAEVV